MRKVIYLLTTLIVFMLFAANIRAEAIKVGDKFPLEKLIKKESTPDNTIIAFVPSLTEDCEYASMLTQSFYYYFGEKMAFEELGRAPQIRVILVVKDKQSDTKRTRNLTAGFHVVYDEKGDLFSVLNAKMPTGKNADSTIVLLDKNETVALIDDTYRAQGEHLKPLESKIRNLNGISSDAKAEASAALKIGDTAPDFQIDKKRKLSDLRGKVVLVSFYPAAFSGKLPRLDVGQIVTDDGKLLDFGNLDLTSCSIQIVKLDKPPKTGKQPVRIAVSSSTGPLLQKWREALGTHNIDYANDPDYSISRKYSSYDPAGYNKRVSVIVDKKGKIAYIDEHFDAGDEDVINLKMEQLQDR